MKANMGIWDELELRCRWCHDGEHIAILVSTWATVKPDGDTDGNTDRHLWAYDSRCRCQSCHLRGKVEDFMVQEAKATP